MMRDRLILALAGFVMLASCHPAGGHLAPVADAGIALVSTLGQPADTARLSASGVTADVTGDWSGDQVAVSIDYRTTDAAALRLTTSSAWRDQTGQPDSLVDETTESDAPLQSGSDLKLRASDHRKVTFIYKRKQGSDSSSYGDKVTITIPMPASPHPVRFEMK